MKALLLEEVLPTPCTGKGVREKNVYDCILKVKEEIGEVEKAYAKGVSLDNIVSIAEELTDTITACTTALDRLGFDMETRLYMQMYVNEKNRKRGYHA